VVFDTRLLEQKAISNSRWELVYRDSLSQTQYTSGDTGVFRDLDEKPGQAISLASTYAEACSDTIPYCASIETRHLNVIKRNQALAAFLVLIGLTLGYGSGLVTWLILKRRLSTEHRIIRGLKQNAYFPLYQPIVDLENGHVVGCEVLARFQDAYGAIYPDEFIPVLAKARLGWSLTQLIMQKTLSDLDPRTGLPDDFGTGYSNLSKVRDLGCNTLKIDRSFVFDIDTGGLGAALVPLMIRIAEELGIWQTHASS